MVTEQTNPGTGVTAEMIAKANRELAEAQATPCDYEGCDGTDHDPCEPPEKWSHTVVQETFDNGIDGLIVAKPGAGFNGYVDFSNRGDDEWSAADFREAAELYEAFPAWLRSIADQIDALNSK